MTARMQQFNMRLRALFVARRPPPAGRGISLNPHAIAGREIEQQHRAASEKPRKAGQMSCHQCRARSRCLLAANDGTVSAYFRRLEFQFSNFDLYSNQKLAQFRLDPPATQFQVRRKRRSQQRASREYVNCVRCGKTNFRYADGWCTHPNPIR